MTDRYGKLIQSGLGKTVAKNLGLPTPAHLERFVWGQPFLCGEVVFGSSGEGVLKQAALQALMAMDAKITFEDKLSEKLADEQMYFKVVVFDASGIKDARDLNKLHHFFSPLIKRIKPSGKILILARADEDTGVDLSYSSAQKAITGFVKSLAKEVKNGITANVLYVAESAERHLYHSFEFFLSHRSAYVSGQALSLQKGSQIDDALCVDDGLVCAYPRPSLVGKKILVTGAAGGIGQAICQTLLQEGASLYCVDLPEKLEQLQNLANSLNTTHLASQGSYIDILALDICDKNIAKTIIEKASVLDGVVYNAGITEDKTLAKMSLDQWQNVMQVNLGAMTYLTQTLLNHSALSKTARIVCISSIVGISGNFGQSNYATAKAGVLGLTKSLAKVFSLSQKRVNAIAPGFIETPMTQHLPFTLKEAGRRMNAMSQGGKPADVAEATAWLLSPKADGINGQVLRVCGHSVLGA